MTDQSYYSKNRESRIAYQKEYYERNKDKVKEYYSKEEIKAKRAAYMKEYMKIYKARKKLKSD